MCMCDVCVCICLYNICVWYMCMHTCELHMCTVWCVSLFLYVCKCICILVCLHICVYIIYMCVVCICMYMIYMWMDVYDVCVYVWCLCVCMFPRQLYNFSKTTFYLFFISRFSYIIITASFCQILSVILNSSINLFAFVSKFYNLKYCNFMVVSWVALPS